MHTLILGKYVFNNIYGSFIIYIFYIGILCAIILKCNERG